MPGRKKGFAERHKVAVLGGIRLFAACNAEQLAELARLFDEIERPAGSVLVREGEPGSEFYVIVEGSASASIGGTHVNTMGAGDFFGEMALLDCAPRSATVVATSDVSLLVLDKSAFSSFVDAAPSIAPRMMRTIAERLRHAEAMPAGASSH